MQPFGSAPGSYRKTNNPHRRAVPWCRRLRLPCQVGGGPLAVEGLHIINQIHTRRAVPWCRRTLFYIYIVGATLCGCPKKSISFRRAVPWCRQTPRRLCLPCQVGGGPLAVEGLHIINQIHTQIRNQTTFENINYLSLIY